MARQNVYERLRSQNELDQITRALEHAGYDYDIHDLESLVDLYTSPKDLSGSDAGRLRFCRDTLGERSPIIAAALAVEQRLAPSEYGCDLEDAYFSILGQCGVQLDNRGKV